jgi:hypothetical protein
MDNEVDENEWERREELKFSKLQTSYVRQVRAVLATRASARLHVTCPEHVQSI